MKEETWDTPVRGGKGAPLDTPHRRLFSSPKDEFDPHVEACFPVIFDDYDSGRAIKWETIPMKMVKELKHVCSSYGTRAPYTMQLVEALAGRWMSPYDWMTVAKACVSGGQYVLWKAEYDDLAQKQANNNQRYVPTYIVKSMLTGTGDYAILRDQMKLDKFTLQQVTACAIEAWQSLPEGKESTSFLNIKQKPEEPYENFVSWLTEAVCRVISNS